MSLFPLSESQLSFGAKIIAESRKLSRRGKGIQ